MSSRRVLIVCADANDVGGFARLFERGGFDVHCHVGSLSEVDMSGFGAVLQLARSEPALHDLAGNPLPFNRDEEWILVEADSEDSYFCTVQLTPDATAKLRAFVRTLWSQFSVT